MKAFFLLAAALFCLAFAQDNYQLVWSDEFNGNSLDLSKWQYEVNCDGGGNNELQCYTKQPQNLQVADGKLKITVTPQNLNGKQYSSARINTRNSAAWKYGRFEASARIPNAAYLWPALWMMPRDSVYGGWAASGEIDIFEGRGQNNREYQSTLHYGGSWPNNVYRGSGERTYNQDLTTGFHTYSCTWTPQQISFAIDGTTFYTRSLNENFYSGRGANPYSKNGQPFDQPFYYIINVAVGGGFFGGNANALNRDIASRWANPSMEVDWVRVYQLGANPNPNPNPNPVPVPTGLSSKASEGPKATQSVGVSTAKSSAASSAVSSAATSGVTSKETVAQTTFYYSKETAATPAPSNATPAPSNSNNNPNACPNGCGAATCCADAKLGGVCYSTSTHVCLSDSDGSHLCGKGAGYCKSSGCYDANNYKCVNGALAPK